MTSGGGREGRALEPGLWIVSTPIGTARDITLRALDVLAAADVIASEDTRTTRRLLEIHGIPLAGRPLMAYHDHSGPAVRRKLLEALREGRSVACVSDAGTPMVSDPGYLLARETIDAGIRVHAVPGPSAVLAALAVAGLPTDRFFFAGFVPSSSGPRRRFLEDISDIPATIVLFETPRRCSETISELVRVMGGERRAVICRELTKRFEEIVRGRLSDLETACRDMSQKGEAVLVIDRAPERQAEEGDVVAALEEALANARTKDAAREVADRLGLPRREVYQMALRLKGEAT